MQILGRSRVQWFVVVVAVLQRHGNSAFGKWTVLLSCLAGATVREKGISRTDIRMGCIIGVSDRMRGEDKVENELQEGSVLSSLSP